MATIWFNIKNDDGRVVEDGIFDIADSDIEDVYEAVHNAILQSGAVIDGDDVKVYDGD